MPPSAKQIMSGLAAALAVLFGAPGIRRTFFTMRDCTQGYTIPTSIRAGWWFGTNRSAAGEFFRCTVTDAGLYERAMQPHQ